MRHKLLYLLLLFTNTLWAAWRPPITNYTTDYKEGGRQNWKIAQGSNNWIYFANNNGLLEYNGFDWTIRTLENLTPVHAIECSDNGSIYVGGRGEIGCFAPDQMGRLTYTNLISSMPEAIRSFEEVWDIHSIKSHTYFQLRRSIYILNHYGEFRNIPSNGLIMASCIMNNSLYFATSNGLYVMGDSEPIAINLSNAIPFDEINAIATYQESKILISTNSKGFFIYNNGVITPFKTSGDNLILSNQAYSLAVNASHIACGTIKGGVITMDIDGSNAEQHNIKSGMSNNTVLSVKFDPSNNLWCGLDNGIDYIALNSPIRFSDINREFKFSGYCTLSDDKHLYLGTNQGLIRISKFNQFAITQANEHTEVVQNSDGQVWNIQEIDDKIYCCHTRGLFILDKKNNTPTLLPIYTADGVWNIIPIGDNTLLAGTYDGVIKITRERNGTYTSHNIDGYSGSVRDLILQPHMRMGYFVSEHGLERLQFNAEYSAIKNQRLIESTSFDIKLIHIDNQIIVYSPQAIYYLNDDGSLQQSSSYDYLFNLGELYSMVSVNQKECIWYVSDNNLLHRPYDATMGKFADQSQLFFNDSRFFIKGFTRVDPLDDRYYILNGVDGFSIIDSEWIPSEREVIYPRIIGIYDTNNQDSLLISNAYGLQNRSIELPYKSNSIQILFGNSTANDQGVDYSYMLEGSDNEWSQWHGSDHQPERGAHNQKEYTQLFEGKYAFNLRLRDSFGNIQNSVINIVILPPWQRSKPMYLLYSIIIISAILYSRSRINRYYADRRKLIEIQSIRQIEMQKRRFESQAIVQENNIIKLKNEKLESDVRAKSAELSNLLLNKLEKNDIISSVKISLEKIKSDAVAKQHESVVRRVTQLEKHLEDKMIDNVDWSIFEDNFNITNNNFVQKISEQYSWMSINDRKLCIYIKMGLQNKEIAPLLNLSVRGVEMLRYRIRKKMELDRNENLYEFFQRFA